jgi:hypothetical protein
VTEPDLQALFEEEFEKRFAQRVETCVAWMVAAGGEPENMEDEDDDSFISAQCALNGIDYFIGRPTLDLDFAFELEVGALIYEEPPFSPAVLDSMLQTVVDRFPQEEDILYIENDEGGVWVICRFEGADFADSVTFDRRVRQLVALAEAAHGAVH